MTEMALDNSSTLPTAGGAAALYIVYINLRQMGWRGQTTELLDCSMWSANMIPSSRARQRLTHITAEAAHGAALRD